MTHDVKDLTLADKGNLRIEWAAQSMPVLALIKKRFHKEKPLKGVRLGLCLHVTTETASLCRTLKEGGGEVYLCASNPLSTQDDEAAALVKIDKIPVYAIKAEDHDTYYKHIHSVLDISPTSPWTTGRTSCPPSIRKSRSSSPRSTPAPRRPRHGS